MAYRRAIVNCRRCYSLANEVDESLRLGHAELWVARNEAMKALERAIEESYSLIQNPVINREAESLRETAQNSFIRALDSCLDCQFRTPGIVDELRGESI